MTPEELDRIAEEALQKLRHPIRITAGQTLDVFSLQNGAKDIIRSAIDQALALAAADLIESIQKTRNAIQKEPT